MKAKVPFVPQREMDDCGVACLTAVLRSMACNVDYTWVARLFSRQPQALSAGAILHVARSLGAEAVSISLGPTTAFERLPHLAIVHLRSCHFVVVYDCSGDKICYMDPGQGYVEKDRASFLALSSGVAIVVREGCLDKTVGQDSRSCRLGLSRRFGMLLSGIDLSVERRLLFGYFLGFCSLLGLIIGGGGVHSELFMTDVGSFEDSFCFFHVAAGLLALAWCSRFRVYLIRRIESKVNSCVGAAMHAWYSALPFASKQRRGADEVAKATEGFASFCSMLVFPACALALDISTALIVVLLMVQRHTVLGLGALLGVVVLSLLVLLVWPNLGSVDTPSRLFLLCVRALGGETALKSKNSECRASPYRSLADKFFGQLSCFVFLFSIAFLPFVVLLGRLISGNEIVASVALVLLVVMVGLLAVRVTMNLTLVSLLWSLPSRHRAEAFLCEWCEWSDQSSHTRSASEMANVQALPDDVVVRLADLRFSHRGRKGWELGPLDLSVGRGKRIRLSGPPGSGKRTLCRLIAGLYDPVGGTRQVRTKRGVKGNALRDLRVIFCDAKDARNGETIRQLFLGQNPSIGRGDMNLALRALGLAGFVGSLPMQLETPLGERGELVSSTQYNRLLIASGLAAQPDVLVLDAVWLEKLEVSESSLFSKLCSQWNVTTIECSTGTSSSLLSSHADQIGWRLCSSSSDERSESVSWTLDTSGEV